MLLLVAALVSFAIAFPLEAVQSGSALDTLLDQNVGLVKDQDHIIPRTPSSIPLTATPRGGEDGRYVSFYTVHVRIGSPYPASDPDSNLFEVLADTGSNILWLFSDLLPPEERVGRRKLLHYTGDRTCITKPDAQIYGDGTSVSTTAIGETISLSDNILPGYSVHATTSINNLPNAWNTYPRDGIFGFPCAGVASFHAVGVDLKGATSASTITLSKDVQSSSPNTNIEWVDVPPKYESWTVDGDDDERYLFDSGSSLVGVADSLASSYYETVHKKSGIEAVRMTDEDEGEGEGGEDGGNTGPSPYWKIPCDAGPKIPPLDLVVGGKQFSIPGVNLIGFEMGNGLCLSLLAASASNDKWGRVNILGIPFFHSYRVFFESIEDQKILHVGMAPKT